MKIKMAIIIACTAVFFGISGCSAMQSEKITENITENTNNKKLEKSEVTFAWWGNPVRDKRTNDALALFSREEPNVTFVEKSFLWDEYWDYLEECEKNNAMPDIIQMDYSYLDKYVEKGMLSDLNPYLESGELNIENIPKSFLEAGYIDGKLYGIPVGMNAPCLMYNKTLTQELGIDIPDYMTVKQFEDISAKVYELSGVKTDLTYESSQNLLPYLVRAKGVVDLFDDEEKKINVDDASIFSDFFQIYCDGAQQGWLMGEDVHDRRLPNSLEDNSLVNFSSPQNQSWCALYWSNQFSAMEDLAPEEMEIGITTWPSSDPKASNFVKPSQFFTVSAAAGDDERAAVRVIDFLTNSIDANGILLGERGVPVSNVVAGAIEYLQDSAMRAVNRYIYEVVAVKCSPISSADPVWAAEVYRYADDLTKRVANGEITPEQAAEMLLSGYRDILDKS